MPRPPAKPAPASVPKAPRRVVNTRYARHPVAADADEPLPVPDAGAVPSPSRDRLDRVRAAKEALVERHKERRMPASEVEGDGPTRTASTIQSYKERGSMLLRRYLLERDLPNEIDSFDPREFAYWFLAIRPTLKPPTWRLYRQSVIMLLGGVATNDAEEALRLVISEASADVEMGNGEPSAQKGQPATRITSAQKEKRFRWEDWRRIDASLAISRRSPESGPLRDWLRAGIAVGLRPSEWMATEVVYADAFVGERQRIFLHVLNAKTTNGRGNGPVRTIELTDVSLQSLGAIERMSKVGATWFEEGTFDLHQRKCGQLLYKMSERFFKRRNLRYALYSCRHQFFANMKALGIPNEEVSALAGHTVDDTVATKYAKAASGWSPDKILDRPRGLPEEIAKVRKVLAIADERLRLVAIAKGAKPDDSDTGVEGVSSFEDA